MISVIMIETISRGSFNHDQTDRIQNGGWMRRRHESAKEPKLELYEAKCLVEVWADEEIQRQLAAMETKHMGEHYRKTEREWF